MRFKALVVSSFLLLAANNAFAHEPVAQTEQGRTQSVINQTTGFNDNTTGPTNPPGQVQSPD